MIKIKAGLFIFLFFYSFCFSSLLIDGSYYRKVQSYKGTIHIFLYNNSDKEAKIEKIYYNGEELKDIPDDNCLWYQITPSEIPPKGYCDLKIKQRWDTTKLMKISFIDTEGRNYETTIEPTSSFLSFVGAYFDNELKNLYIYIQNISSQRYTLKGLLLNGKDITGDCFIPEREIRAGEKIVVIYGMKQPVNCGQYLYLKGQTEQGDNFYTLTRVYGHFVIDGYGGDNRQEMNFNKERFDFHYNEKKLSEFSELPEFMACHIYDDPACVDGTKKQLLGTSAKEIIERTEKFYQHNKKHPTFIYSCEHIKPDNYFLYAETTDVFVIDPYEITYYHNPPEKDAYYTQLAKLACQPRILWTIPEAFTYRGTRYQTPEEERIIVWSEIGEGSKGIWYFVYDQKIGYPANKELEEEIKKINWELQKLKDYLIISEPITRTEKDKMTTYTLLAGDKGIVLILVNNDHTSNFQEGQKPFEYNPKENVKIEIKIPNWLKVKGIKEITYPEEKEINQQQYKIENNTLFLSVDNLEITKQYLIEAERK